jgi:bifunctional UDP-N-acetylglucosamine pyrophosphorylase/glucosamine-1-phosphate N-acetyltransferase
MAITQRGPHTSDRDAARRADRAGGGRRDADELGPSQTPARTWRPPRSWPMRWRRGAPSTPEHVIVVTGHGAEAVEAARGRGRPRGDLRPAGRAERHRPRGAAGRPALEGFEGDAVVLYADTPFLTPGRWTACAPRGRITTWSSSVSSRRPGRYGRLVMEGDALAAKIVEFKDATPGELRDHLLQFRCDGRRCRNPDGASGRGPAAERGRGILPDRCRGRCPRRRGSAGAVLCPQDETLGVDSRAGLAQAEARFQALAAPVPWRTASRSPGPTAWSSPPTP